MSQSVALSSLGSAELENQVYKLPSNQQDADGIAQIEELKEEEFDDLPEKRDTGLKEDEDAFFDELDMEMIDEGVTTNNMTTLDKAKQTKSQIK